MDTIERDRQLIADLGGPTRVADLLGMQKRGGPQRVQNWLSRGIPAAVKVRRPDLFMPDLASPQSPAVQVATHDTSAEVEDDAPAQPMDLAGQCDNNRRATPEADAGNGPCLQPPDIDGESEEAPPPAPPGLAADAANGQPVPPPGFSGQDENGSPAVPLCDGDDSQPLLVLDDAAGKAA